MKELFRKYLDNQCSPDEVRELLRYFNIPDNEALLREMILESLEEEEAEQQEEVDLWQANTKKSLEMITSQLNTEKVKVIPLFKKTWFRIAAAAILLLGGIAAYKIVNNTGSPKREIVTTDATQAEIGPGSNKAILTLANGSTIMLDKAADGHLAQEGNTEITKSNNSELTYALLNEKSKDIYFNSVSTPRGGKYQLALSDGTIVWLNAASSIHFPVAFNGNKRTVEITGEAYFEVAKNPSMPFIVNIAGKAEVEVLGTHFNVNAYSDEAEINTTLLEGKVKVTELASRESRIIEPGQQARINTNGQLDVNKNVDTSQATAWKNGLFNFEDASLETVLRQVSRWYDVDVVFEGPVPQRKFDGEIQRGLNLSQVVKLLEKNHLHFRIEGRTLIVQK